VLCGFDGVGVGCRFLKVLNLFANEIVTRPEMIRMMEDIFGDKHLDLIEKFKNNIGQSSLPP
jgi:hypothetical protein